MRSLAKSALFFACLLASNHARARGTCQPANLLSTCLDADNLWVHAGSDWLSQGPSQLPKQAEIWTRLATSYLLQPIGLRRASADPEGTTSYPVEHRLGATAVAAFGLGRGLALEAALPFVPFQSGSSTADLTGSNAQLPVAALGDLRLSNHFRWPLRQTGKRRWTLATRLSVAFPTGNDHAFSSAAGMVFAPAQHLGLDVGRWHFGADVGLRIQQHTQFANALIGSQLSTSLGGGVDLIREGWLRLDLEAFGWLGLLRQTVQERSDDGTLKEFDSQHLHWPAEWLLSVRSTRWLSHRLSTRLALGSFIPTGASSPTTPLFRALLSVDYRFGATKSTGR